MLIKWGSIVVKGSGKLGGHVFSGGPGGASVHTLAKARNPQTKYQMAIRARFNLLTQSWRDLTEVQRESWYGAESEFSRKNRFGDVVTLSGKNLYESLNINRQILGLGVIDIAPLPVELFKNLTREAYIASPGNRLVILGDYVGGEKYVIVATPGVSMGAKNIKNEFRNLSVVSASGNGVELGGGTANYTAYINRFGVPMTNTKLLIGSYSINASGQKSTVSSVRLDF